MAGLLVRLARLTLPLLDADAARPVRLAIRGFLLMRRVRMILRLEVLGLVWWTLAIADQRVEPALDGFENMLMLPTGYPPLLAGVQLR